jgi:hypothetical protein
MTVEWRVEGTERAEGYNDYICSFQNFTVRWMAIALCLNRLPTDVGNFIHYKMLV